MYKIFKIFNISASYKSIWLLQECIIMSYIDLTPPSSFKKNSPHSKLKHPSRNIFQLPLLSSGILNSEKSIKSLQLKTKEKSKFVLYCLDLELFAKIKKHLVSAHSHKPSLSITQELNKMKKSWTFFCRHLVSRKGAHNFSIKY